MTRSAVGAAADARIGVPLSVVWTEPGAARDIDEPVVRESPDPAAWTAVLDFEARNGLHGRSVTQALLGERVRVVAERGGWSEIRLLQQPSSLSEQGYPGWVPSSHLVAAVDEVADEAAIVSALTVRAAGRAPLELSFGTILPVVGDSAAGATLRHPDGSDIVVPRTTLRPLPASASTIASSLVWGSAQLFSGLPYLWGGLSGHGVDCSGLVHLTHRALGVVIARDAADQERAAEGIELVAARPGEPVYFENGAGVHHVGLVADVEWMLHAPRTGTSVRTERIDTADYEGERILARRFPTPTTEH